MKEEKLLIFTATLNEVDNILEWYKQIRSYYPYTQILVVDDNSSDGTLEILNEIKLVDTHFDFHLRPRKLGVGSAHQYAQNYAYDHHFNFLLTMDADLSHMPSQIGRFVEAADKYDFVVGTRWVGGTCNYQGLRLFMSKNANRLMRNLIPTGLSEYTTSFRIFNSKAIITMLNNPPDESGYGYFVETIELMFRKKLKLGEVPINFQDRNFGKSKIPKNQIFKSAFLLLKLYLGRLIR